jgi:DNA-binding MarR family transcriptional regulator
MPGRQIRRASTAMPSPKHDRKHQLMKTVTDECRSMSTRTVLLHSTVADKLGLGPTDHKCVDLIVTQKEPLTAGRLAELTGLSTGAITGVLDRLENAGFVARAEDPNDRRRVVIRYTPERAPDLGPFFAPLRAAMLSFCDRYTTRELEVILSFMRGTGEVVAEQVARLEKLDVRALRPVRASGAEMAGVRGAPPADIPAKPLNRRVRRSPV